MYRDKKLKKLCAYVFFTFYVKVPVRTFLKSENCHFPRFDIDYYINLKLLTDLRSQLLQDVNDNAIEKLVKYYVSTTNDNGKAPSFYSSAMTIHSKMSLHAFGSEFAGYFCIWREKKNVLE